MKQSDCKVIEPAEFEYGISKDESSLTFENQSVCVPSSID